MSNQESIESSKAPEPVGLYPHARRVGNKPTGSGAFDDSIDS